MGGTSIIRYSPWASQAVEPIGAFFVGVAALGISIMFAPPQFTFAFMLGSAVLSITAFVYGAHRLRNGELASSVGSVLGNARQVVREKIHANDVADRIWKASSLTEVRAALDERVDVVRVLDVELVAGDVHHHCPER